MKHLLFIIAVLLSFFQAGRAQTAQSDTEEEGFYATFRVQVGAATQPLPKAHKLFTELPDVEEIPFDDGYYRYYCGKFETFFKAETFMNNEVKPKGYPQAYIVAFHKGKRYTVDEAIDLIYGDE